MDDVTIEGMLAAYRNLYAQIENGMVGEVTRESILAWLEFECEVLSK